MKTCDKCARTNPDDALFCQHCGTPISSEAESSIPPLDEGAIWRAFIGPNADRYLEQFRKFTSTGTPRFALTWHWPAFLVDPFLWFLYRKMYLYAVVYAVGPVVSAYVTGDFTVGIVWRIMAGVSANYIYYWHAKEHVTTIRAKSHLDGAAQARLLRDLGGVQPYVIWLAVVLHVLLIAMMIIIAREGPPDGEKDQPARSKPAAIRTSL
ncbi:MAG: DUF2628 domain-containing protein [Nitrospiraceae bacterium]